jgi:hypothetical protein
MPDILRDSARGQVICLVTGNKYLLYEEERTALQDTRLQALFEKPDTPGSSSQPSGPEIETVVNSVAETVTETSATGILLT